MYRARPWTRRQIAGFGTAPLHQRTVPLSSRPRPDRSEHGLRSPYPDRLRLGPRAGRGGGRTRRGGHRHHPGHGPALRRSAAGQGRHLLHDQPSRNHDTEHVSWESPKPGACRGTGCAGTVQNDSLKEFFGQKTYALPAAAFAEADDRHRRVLHAARPQLVHRVHLRLPHPRGWLQRRPGARLYTGPGDGLRRIHAGEGPERRRVSLPGSPSSSGATTTCSRRWQSSAPRGESGARVMKERYEARSAESMRMRFHTQDAWLDTRPRSPQEQHHAGSLPGLGRGPGRHAVPPRKRLRRGVRHTLRGGNEGLARHPAGHSPRDQRSQHRRPSGRLILRRVADRPHGRGGLGLHRHDREHGRRQHGPGYAERHRGPATSRARSRTPRSSMRPISRAATISSWG